jgi:hypothetical protein
MSSALRIFLPPTLAMVALSYTVAFSILATRSADLVLNKRPVAYHEDFDTASWPVWLMRPTRQLANLFEFPVLFYALTSIAISAGLRDSLLAKLCWAYAGLRYAHAVIHILYNRLWLRMPLFITGNLLLASGWILLAVKTLS